MEIGLFMKLNTEHIYICHYTKLKDRKIFIEQQLKALNIDNNYEFIEMYDADLIDQNTVKNKYPYIFSKTKRDNRYLRLPEISIALKHCYAIKDAKLKKYRSVLILEDDATFHTNFCELYNKYIEELPDDWHLFWPGSCCNLNINHTTENKHIYKSYSSRCCHCYSIGHNGIDILFNTINSIDEAIDWYYNDIITKYNLNTYWAEPPICFQNHNFNSTIQQ